MIKHSYKTNHFKCDVCGMERQKGGKFIPQEDRSTWTWFYLVNGKWTFKRPNCKNNYKQIAMTAI